MGKAEILEETLQMDDVNTKVFAYGFITLNLTVTAVENFLGQYGLSMGEFTVMWYLQGVKEEINLKAVKEGTLIYSGASITKVADKLLHKGFITRRENPASRREKLVKSTPAGMKLCSKVLNESKKVFGDFVAGMSAPDKRQLLNLYKIIFGNVHSG